jgi:hypothetical protein
MSYSIKPSKEGIYEFDKPAPLDATSLNLVRLGVNLPSVFLESCEKSDSQSAYGYLVWTDNIIAPNTVWAQGRGGQLIGWNYSNDRILVTFSNYDSSSAKVYAMSKEWNAIK